MQNRNSNLGRREFISVAGGIGAAAGLVLLGTPEASAASPFDAVPAVVNGSFEQGLTGWHSTGTPGAAHLDKGGAEGTGARLTHWSGSAYTAVTTQRLTRVGPGWLTVGAWVKSGGQLGCSRLALSDGRREQSVVIPNTEKDDGWVYVAVSLRVGTRTATVSLRTGAPGGTWATVDLVSTSRDRVSRAIRGADLSSVLENEDCGAVYYDSRGRRQAPEKILAAAGANLGRLKVWVHPANGYNDTAHVVEMAGRIKRAGMRLLIDFHYSDTWTDPGAQHPPAAWRNFTAAQLTAAVGQHTHDVLTALKSRGITADFVQVGNEINSGMLWPLGQTWDVDPTDEVSAPQWDNLSAFLTAGYRAAKAVDAGTTVLLHLTNVNNGIDSLTWWLDSVVARQVPFDLIGLSFYEYWHGSLRDLQSAITALSDRYDRDVLVVETAYPWTLEDDPHLPFENNIDTAAELATGYPATPTGQAANVGAIADVVASAPGGRGIGTVYWEPAWTAVPGAGWNPTDPASGNAWENQAMFDWSGHALPAIAHFAP